MKLIRLSIVVATLLLGVAAYAQAPQGPAPQGPRPNPMLTQDWADFAKYAQANEAVTMKPKVVFMGDSITEYWVDQDPAFFTDNNFIGRGISGQTSSKMLARFYRDVVELHPDAVVISCGTNDVAHNNGVITLENVVTQIKAMVDIARFNGIKPIVVSVPPCDFFFWRREIEHPAPTIIELNKLIKAYTEEAGIPYVDYHGQMAAPDGSFPKEYSNDGCHPVIAGYKMMESIVLPVINATLASE